MLISFTRCALLSPVYCFGSIFFFLVSPASRLSSAARTRLPLSICYNTTYRQLFILLSIFVNTAGNFLFWCTQFLHHLAVVYVHFWVALAVRKAIQSHELMKQRDSHSWFKKLGKARQKLWVQCVDLTQSTAADLSGHPCPC